MIITEAKLLFETRTIFDPIVYNLRDEKEWCLQFKCIPNIEIPFSLFLETERGQMRIFKDVKAAVNSAKRIGFEKVLVDFNPPSDLSFIQY